MNCENYIKNILEVNFNTVSLMKYYTLSYIEKSKTKNQIKISSKVTKYSKFKYIYPFSLILMSSNIYPQGNTYINFVSISNSFWELLTKEITILKNEKMLQFLIHLYVHSLCHIPATQNDIFITLFNKAYKLLVQLLCPQQNNDKSISQNVINFSHVVLYSYYMRYERIPLKEISYFLQKNSFLFTKIFSILSKYLPRNIELLGFHQDKNEYIFEFPLKQAVIPTKTIRYEEHTHIIVVDIQVIRPEEIQSKFPDKYIPSKDIIIKSNYHLGNAKGLTWNNYRDFGTSFFI